MIRRVAFKKAVLGGALGALAWEVVARAVSLAGIPIFDIVRVLGTMLLGPDAPAWQWWLTGMTMHALVGSVWATFYAYFFWSLFDRHPIIQGLLFSLFPALMAGLIMVPQMDLMLNGSHPPLRLFGTGLGAYGPLWILGGHLIYGLVLGFVYQRPVGYRVGKRVVYG